MTGGGGDGPLLECVPNVSEGRDPAVLDALADAASSVEGAALLHLDADASHHRAVLTLAGPAGPLGEAVFRLVRVASERVDLSRHAGEHPRIGAADVVPFVPLAGMDLGRGPGGAVIRGASMEAAVSLARRTGSRIAEELGIPVFLYGEAARRPGRTVPAAFRRGGFEALREAVATDPEREPDLGPRRVHPTAGATAVGARRPLVAFNVYLETRDVEVARRIARRVRASGGGLPGVQALGFRVDGRAQVSTNLLDVETTGPAELFDAVRREAAEERVGVADSEIVGLVPERALPPDADRRLRLRTPGAGRVLEARIRSAFGG